MSDPVVTKSSDGDQPTIIADLSRSTPATDLPTVLASAATDPNAATIPALPPGSGTTRPTINASAMATMVAAPPKDDLAGQVWGDFVFAGLLGRGGMGAVYRGNQVSLNRPVAIKVLPAHLSGDEGFRARFELEAKAVAQINSPHVIQVYGAGIHQGQHFFAMEYVEGSDLSQRLKSGEKPSRRQALEWLTQAARGLAAAGEHGIVHRDIKPGNMMVTKKNVLKLMDFGLVKLASEGHHLTQTGTIMGTVTYFSPEQGRGESCDCRTDIYALGVVFYELVTGRLPFTGQDATSIIYQHIHVPPTPPRAFAPDTPEDWQAVVLKCMQKDAAGRYATAADLVADLERLGRDQAPALPPRELAALRKGLVPGAAGAAPSRLPLYLGLGGLGLAAAGFGIWLTVKPVPMTAVPTTSPAVTTQSPPVTSGVQSTAPSTAMPKPLSVAGVDTAARLRLLIAEGSWIAARALAKEQVQLNPTEVIWTKTLNDIDQGEANEYAARGRRALADGDLDMAESLATQASSIKPDAGRDLTAAVNATRSSQERRGAAIAQAETLLAEQRHGEAEAILVTLAAAEPHNAKVSGLLSQAKAARQTQQQALSEATTNLATGQAALAVHDHDAARAAFTAASTNAGTASAAREGLKQVEAASLSLASQRQLLTEQLAARDFAAADTTLVALQSLALPNIIAQAESDVATAKLKDDERHKAAEAEEAARGSQAKALILLIDDPTSTIPQLEAGLIAFIAEAGANRPEQPLLERRIEDRRQAQVVTTHLADLDRGVLTGDHSAIGRRVTDPTFATALGQLSGYRGLAFASTLAGFTRDGDKATATVNVRHALAVFPERELHYLFELNRDASGWRIAAAHLQP